MKRLYGWVVGLIWVCGAALCMAPAAWAQEAETSAPVEARQCPPPLPHVDAETFKALYAAGQPDRGVLWRLEKDGHTSYLFGTIHVAQMEWDVLGPLTLAALRGSQRIAVELDVSNPQAFQASLMKTQAGRPKIGAAAEAADKALAAEVSKRYRALCIDDSKIALNAKTRLLGLQTLAALDTGLTPAFALDAVMAGFAHATHRELVQLETARAQLDAFSSGLEVDAAKAQRAKGGKPQSGSASAAADAAILESFDDGSIRKGLIRVADAWEHSDLQELTAVEEEMRNTAEAQTFYQRVVVARNVTLAQRIDAFFRGDGQGFAAIGTLHLVGRGSVVAALQKMGYTATLVVPAQAPGEL